MEEVELKFRLREATAHARLRVALAALGARPHPPQHEENRIYADAAGTLSAEGKVLRLRIVDRGPAAVLTYKGPARYEGAVKQREEIEVDVADAERAHALLGALGYSVAVTYEKERERWRLGEVEVALDTLPFGHFCVVEGPAEAIGALARRLGLDERDAEPLGYPALQREFQRQKAQRKRKK